ncbi:MAG: SAVED domain-containing protein [Pseudomonadota bacterium]
MAILAWAQGQISKLVDWVTRKRNLGLGLLGCSSLALVGLASGDVAIEVKGFAGILDAAKFSTGGGLSGVLLNLAVCAVLLVWILGALLVIASWWQERREANLNRVFVVEMRGLEDTTDHPLKNAIPAALPGRRVDRLVNVRPLLTGATPNVPEALKELDHIQRDVRLARGDTAREHVKVVAGGVMQVSLLFFVGTLLGSSGKAVFMDWDRTQGRWRELADADDGSRFAISGLDTAGTADAVVVAVSASYAADLKDVAATFPNMPLVHLSRPNPKPNTLWSEDTQAALAQQFLDTLADLNNIGVKTVHLVLAASSSLCLRLGSVYDHRNHPKLRCYQRERDQVPPYPWSVQMPTALKSVEYVTT